GNDGDADFDPLTVAFVSPPDPAQGRVAWSANGSFTFTPAPNFNGQATFSYQASDGQEVSNTAVVTINVTLVNDPPSGFDRTVTIAEEGPYAFTLTDFPIADASDNPANSLQAVIVTTSPAAGSLRLNGVLLSAGTTITAADISAGNYTFTPAANGNGSPYTSFQFRVQD